MWIIVILLIIVIVSVVVFKFLLKNKKDNPINTYDTDSINEFDKNIDNNFENNSLNIKVKPNTLQTSEMERKPLKLPLRPRNTDEVVDADTDITPSPKETDEPKEEKKVEAKNEILDLDDLFKTISITTEGEDEDFDFGLRSKNDR